MKNEKLFLVPLADIIIKKEERQRKTLEGIPDLAASIAARGLIQPIVLDENYVLVAGERRCAAHVHLGRTHILARFVKDLSPDEKFILEYEENIRRQDLSWQDKALTILAYHEMQQRLDPEWTQSQTAKELQLSPSAVSDNISVAEELKIPTSMVHKAERFSIASNMVARIKGRMQDAVLENVVASIKQITKPKVESTETTEIVPLEVPVLPYAVENVDFELWLKQYKGPRFNLIHCDFPYGINIDKEKQGTLHTINSSYEDTEEIYFHLLSVFATNLDKIAADSCHLVFWFSMNFYEETLAFLREKTNFVINPFPLVWHKSDNVGFLPDSTRGPRRIYETAFLGSRGDRKIVRAVSNLYSAPTVSNAMHPTQKSIPMLKHFFSMLIDEHSTLLDPTCGSGAAIQAAAALKASFALGLEINPEFAKTAQTQLLRYGGSG